MKNKKLPVIIGVAALVIALIIAAIVIALVVFANKGHRVIKVESFSGNVALERGDTPEVIFEDMNLKTEDVITTGSDGLIGLLADEDKNIAAVENTCFAIVSEGNDKKGSLKIELKYGTSLIEIENKLEDGSTFEVETPNASLSVRGTTFEVSYDPDTNTTILKVKEGSVQAETNVESEMVDGGEMAIITDTNIVVSELIDWLTPLPDDSQEPVSGETEGNVSKYEVGDLIQYEDWPTLLKGGSDYNGLQFLLETAGRSEYEGGTDYLTDALYWMSVNAYKEAPVTYIEKKENGEVVYDVAVVNEFYSFLTTDTINEGKLTPGVQRLEGDRLICTQITDVDAVERIASAGIIEARYGENGEIIVDFLFKVIPSATLMEVETHESYEKKAHLVPDETGKYVLDYIE